MTDVIFGARSGSFLVNSTIKHDIKTYKDVYPTAFRISDSRLNVDDLIHSLEDTDFAYTNHEEIRLILGEADFNMRK